MRTSGRGWRAHAGRAEPAENVLPLREAAERVPPQAPGMERRAWDHVQTPKAALQGPTSRNKTSASSKFGLVIVYFIRLRRISSSSN